MSPRRLPAVRASTPPGAAQIPSGGCYRCGNNIIYLYTDNNDDDDNKIIIELLPIGQGPQTRLVQRLRGRAIIRPFHV